MLYAERHRPRGVGLAGAVHRTWAVAEKNDWQFSNPRIDTDATPQSISFLIFSMQHANAHKPRQPKLTDIELSNS